MIKRAALMWIILAAIPSQLSAAPTPPNVDTVLAALHTEDFLGLCSTFFDQATARHKKDPSPLTEAMITNITSIRKRIYQGKNLLAVFRQAYAKASNHDDMSDVFNWLSSGAGIKLRQGYTTAYKVDDKARKAYFEEQNKAILKPNRANAMRTFDLEWRQVELLTTFQIGIDEAVLYAMNAYQPADKREAPKALNDRAKSLKMAYDKPSKDLLKVFDFYLFKDLKNEEIDDLTKYAHTKAGEAHIKAYNKALAVTLEGAAYTLQEQIIKSLK